MYSHPEEISSMIKDIRNDEKVLTSQITDICFFMKGGINWDQAWGMSYEDRSVVVKVISKRLKEMSGDKTEYM